MPIHADKTKWFGRTVQHTHSIVDQISLVLLHLLALGPLCCSLILCVKVMEKICQVRLGLDTGYRCPKGIHLLALWCHICCLPPNEINGMRRDNGLCPWGEKKSAPSEKESKETCGGAKESKLGWACAVQPVSNNKEVMASNKANNIGNGTKF